MPRSSRHKSIKHSGKDAREHSDSEEDGNNKDRKVRDEAGARVSRDSASSEKRKLVSQSQDGKDQSFLGNGDLSEEYVVSKKRKERGGDAAVSDRWNGGEIGRDGSSAVDKEKRGESYRQDLEKGLKSKVSVDSKSKSSRRHEGLSERKEEKIDFAESEDAKRSTSASEVELRGKSEKDLSRKEASLYKDAKEKDHGEERSSRKPQDGRRDRSLDRVPVAGALVTEASRKQAGAVADDHSLKEAVENPEWQMQDDLRNPELEKELEKRIRKRRDGSDDKDKYQDDARGANERRLSNRDDRSKNTRHKDEKSKGDDKYRDKYREDYERDHRNRDDKHRDDRYSKDRTGDRYSRDETKAIENHHKKSKTQASDHDDSPQLDERGSRYKGERVKKRSSDDEDHSDLKPRRGKEHRYEVEKKSSSKIESPADRGGRSHSRHADTDSTVSISRRKSSPSSSAHLTKDQSRHSSKLVESKYKDSVYEERVRMKATPSRELTGVSERASESRSLEKPRSIVKPKHKDENHLSELSVERSPKSDSQASPMPLKEKSHSSTSVDWKHSSRATVRRSLDVEETGRRSYSSKDARDYLPNDDRGSQEVLLDKPAVDEFSQADGDAISVSSSFNRNSHFPSSSASLLPPPPPFRTGIDSPSVFGSSEEDSRGKSSNRYKRSSEPNVGRGQENAWKGVPNWPSPATNGFLPFQHGPPPGGFHAMMQQFPAPPLFGVRPSMELNPTGVPYHIPNADRFSGHGRPFGWRNPTEEGCPPHLHGWDASNGVFVDESHMLGRPDWDHNRHLMGDLAWEANSEMWKGPGSAANMESSALSQKEDVPRGSPDEVWVGKPGQRSRNERSRSGSRVESIEIKRSVDTPSAKDNAEAPVHSIQEKTPETPKAPKDNSSHYCRFYLSKLDISVDLTKPEVYEQCLSLLNVDEMPAHGDVTKHESAQDHNEIEVMISNNSWSALSFPTIKDSALQRAMMLYKKQSEHAKLRFSKSSFSGSQPQRDQAADGDKLELDPTMTELKQESVPLVGEEEHKPGPTSTEAVAEEPVPTSTQAEAEDLVPTEGEAEDPVPTEGEADAPVPVSTQVEAEDPVPASNQLSEEPVESSVLVKVNEPYPNSDQVNGEETISNFSVEKVEDTLVLASPGKEKKPGEPVLFSKHLENMEAVKSFNLVTLEEAVEDIALEQALPTTTSPSNEDDVNMAGDTNCNHSAYSSEKQAAFSDNTTCESLGFIFDSSEPAEALTSQESIECSRLVNLSRIHNSPKSTH